jgi:hypothetical protein
MRYITRSTLIAALFCMALAVTCPAFQASAAQGKFSSPPQSADEARLQDPDEYAVLNALLAQSVVNQAAQNIGRLSSSCGSIDAMNKRKSSRITGVFVILFGFLPLLNSLSNPRLASAHGSDRLQLIAVGLCFGIGACLLAGLFRFPGE